MATLEEARHCPKCGSVGDNTRNFAGPRNSTIKIFVCRNTTCKWYNTGWTVQLNADGTVPERSSTGAKDFPDVTKSQENFAKRYLEHLEDEMKKGETNG